MRKVLIGLLLAGAAATPAFAGPHNWSDRASASQDRQSAQEDRSQAREERAQAREDKSQARDEPRSQRAERPSFAPQQQQQQYYAPRQDGRPDRQANADAMRAERDAYGRERDAQRDARVAQRDANVAQRERFDDRRQQARDLRQSQRPLPGVVRNRPPVVSNVPRPGTQPPVRTDGYHGSSSHHWNTNWRHDNHYDWHNYRNHHRSIFHVGFYFDPYGWGYSPFQIGWRLWPGYYGSQYWINDPWMYRLPYAPPGLVWVRYWNDALLVDTWSGEVVDVIPGFFW